MKRIPVVEILWLDASDQLDGGWTEVKPLKVLPHTELMPTYGLLVGEDDWFYYHASTLNPDTMEGRNMGFIPKAMVHSIRILEYYYYEEDPEDNTVGSRD